MKKILFIVLTLLILAGCAAAGGPGRSDNDSVLTIEDRFFVTQVNQIFADRQAYLGRTVRYEGIFMSARWGDQDFHYVIRNTHGCCGPDGMIGFEVLLGDIQPPQPNAWVEVVGVLEEVQDEFQTLLVLNTTSLTEMADRGREFVE